MNLADHWRLGRGMHPDYPVEAAKFSALWVIGSARMGSRRTGMGWGWRVDLVFIGA